MDGALNIRGITYLGSVVVFPLLKFLTTHLVAHHTLSILCMMKASQPRFGVNIYLHGAGTM